MASLTIQDLLILIKCEKSACQQSKIPLLPIFCINTGTNIYNHFP